MNHRDLAARLREIFPEERILRDVLLSQYTTFQIGGPADFMVTPANEEQLSQCLALCHQENVPIFVLGRGSNVLVSDAGFRGVVIRIGSDFQNVEFEENMVMAQSGILLSKLSRLLLERELAGFEFASGIPGTLGGAIYMNAGAYGGEMKDLLREVTAMDENGTCRSLSADELELGYRTSLFQSKPWVVVRALLRMESGQRQEIQERIQLLNEQRRSKQPLEQPSAGSVFKRPPGHFAGHLITEAGLKGCRVGDAMVSNKHAGFIVNAGHATSADVVALIRAIQEKVRDQFGVDLVPELRYLDTSRLKKLN